MNNLIMLFAAGTVILMVLGIATNLYWKSKRGVDMGLVNGAILLVMIIWTLSISSIYARMMDQSKEVPKSEINLPKTNIAHE